MEYIVLPRAALATLSQGMHRFLTNPAVHDVYDREFDRVFTGIALRHDISLDTATRPAGRGYGMEVELSLNSAVSIPHAVTTEHVTAWLRSDFLYRGFGRQFSIQKDGTVPYGFEIVTGVLDELNLRRAMVVLVDCAALRMMWDSKANTGVHFTVDKFPHSWQTLLFYNMFNDKDFLRAYKHIIGRNPNRFCKVSGFVRTIREAKSFGKYSAVNIRKNGSIEVRLFRTDLTKLAQQFELVRRVEAKVLFARRSKDLATSLQDLKDSF